MCFELLGGGHFELLGGGQYDILQLGKILVHQPFIPAYGGNIGFAKKHYAKATAQLMMNKMNQGIFPPSLTRLEIDSILGVK